MKCVLHIIFAFICAANSAKILGIVPTPSYSHQIAYQSLWKELSLRGHQVTTITTQPINDPKLVNLTEIDVKHLQTNSLILEAVTDSGGNTIAEVRHYFQMMIQAIDAQLDYDPIKRLISDQDENFDLVIVEYFFGSPLAFATRFNCPSIGMVSVDAWNVMHHSVGNPTHPILYPDSIALFPQTLSLAERVANFFLLYFCRAPL
ncbi:hypothetical protein RI129_012499 [Pyrocoelia pectoralis]|uniref:Ecdysteroid UDP-glucosyltransferase n=1 Tax=Pyrocoelia pectoralis TaxID=417401 RepID=A0AAN7V6D1_9COLE